MNRATRLIGKIATGSSTRVRLLREHQFDRTWPGRPSLRTISDAAPPRVVLAWKRYAKQKRRNPTMEPYVGYSEDSIGPEERSEEGTRRVTTMEEKISTDKRIYKDMRRWKRLRTDKPNANADDYFPLRIVSYNILAQKLLKKHSTLYERNDACALPWRRRKPLIVEEIVKAKPNVICLQEMQEDHLDDILPPFKERGFDYIYKARTGTKGDGLLFLYKADQFILREYSAVELFQPGVKQLCKDNVAIVAKLALKDCPSTELVVATTHLLFNPKRHDIRLAQAQFLLAEIERIAFVENTTTGPKYLPIILTGDFNQEPHTGACKFITEGKFHFGDKGHSLETADRSCLRNSLLPASLYITDNCEHFNILTKRFRDDGTDETVLNTPDHQDNARLPSAGHRFDVHSHDEQIIEITKERTAVFNSGTLTHPFRFQSVYKHIGDDGEPEVTTQQYRWITVDYIYFADVEPVEVYTLPTRPQCSLLPVIPNFAIGSDHFCLAATFRVFKKKC